MQNHRIPYTTAAWGMVEDASEPAPFLSVVANHHTKMDAYCCFVRATKFTKNIKKIKMIPTLILTSEEENICVLVAPFLQFI